MSLSGGHPQRFCSTSKDHLNPSNHCKSYLRQDSARLVSHIYHNRIINVNNMTLKANCNLTPISLILLFKIYHFILWSILANCMAIKKDPIYV